MLEDQNAPHLNKKKTGTLFLESTQSDVKMWASLTRSEQSSSTRQVELKEVVFEWLNH